MSTYGFDGLAIDTLQFVPLAFWIDLLSYAPHTFSIGDATNTHIKYLASYQEWAVNSVLNYPLKQTLRDVFASNGTRST